MKTRQLYFKNLRKAHKALFFAGLISGGGLLLMLTSRASTPTASFEAEATTNSGNANVISDDTASGAKALKFNNDSYGTCSGVKVSPEDDLATLANSSSTGTTFCLESGTYSLAQVIRPRAGQMFMATERLGAVLTGNDSTDMAFNGEGVSDVTVKGLIVERFATPDIGGLAAIKASSDWTIVDNEIRYNHKTGIYHESRAVIKRNYIHNNGKMGLGGFKASDALIEENEVAFNHVGDWPSASDTGGSKWVGSTNIVIRNNYFHDNKGNGIWLDGDNLNALVENNRSHNNLRRGIFYEISCAGIVRNNIMKGNGEAGLNIDVSRDVEVYGNQIENNGKGIEVYHQHGRGGGTNCEWLLDNIRIHDNTIILDKGYTAIKKWNVTDGDSIFEPSDGRVKFFDNEYVVSGVAKPFHFYNNLRTWEEWRSYGQDAGSAINFN